MKKVLGSLVKFILFFGFGFLILYLVYYFQQQSYVAHCAEKGIPSEDCSLLKKLWADILTTNYYWVGLSLFAYMLSNVSRARRWQIMVKPLGKTPRFANSFHATMLGYLTNLVIPRAGEFLRAGALSNYEKIPVEKVLGTIVLGRIMDVLSFATVILIALLLQYDVIWGFVQNQLNGDLLKKVLKFALLGIAGLGLIVFLFRTNLKNSKIGKKLHGLVLGLFEGIASIRKLDRPWEFIGHTIFIWLMYYMMTWLILRAFPVTEHLGPLAGLMVFTLGSLGMLAPSPGGMGSYHFMVISALALYGISGEDAFSVANIIFFTLNIFGNVLFGLIAFYALPIINRQTASNHEFPQ